jgi:CO/xanthine dehydrogenase FAD-binding subunit
VAAGCVAPIPLRCPKAEAAVEAGRDASEALQEDIAPIDDLRSTVVYRRRVAANVLAQLVQRLS